MQSKLSHDRTDSGFDIVQGSAKRPAQVVDISYANHPAQHLPRAKDEFTLVVERLKKAIRKKEGWEHRVNDPTIRARYVEEAIAQGASKEAINVALQELDLYENSFDDFDFNNIVSDSHITAIDGVIPEDLRLSLESQLDNIANSPQKDFHPNSGNKIQDIIHPSLFPYIAQKPPAVEKPSVFGIYNHCPLETSIYQWLPAVFHVSSDLSKVSIRSYINNLDQDEHPGLYRDIAKIFEHLAPKIIDCVNNYLFTGKDGKEYQVIVKACNYVLKPGQSYEGVWHVEGLVHEHIVASAIYCYSSSEHLLDNGLAFRVANHYDYGYGPQGESRWAKNTPLGAIRTPAGRSVIFSNRCQHRVTHLENTSPTETAVQKILCFFVVDPKHPIVDSRQIPPQQWDKISKKQQMALLLIAKRFHLRLPQDVVKLILRYAKVGYSLKEAKKHRKKMMEERQYITSETNNILEREFSRRS